MISSLLPPPPPQLTRSNNCIVKQSAYPAMDLFCADGCARTCSRHANCERMKGLSKEPSETKGKFVTVMFRILATCMLRRSHSGSLRVNTRGRTSLTMLLPYSTDLLVVIYRVHMCDRLRTACCRRFFLASTFSGSCSR